MCCSQTGRAVFLCNALTMCTRCPIVHAATSNCWPRTATAMGTQGGGGGSGSVWMNGYSIALSVRYNWSGFKINECGLLRTTHAHTGTQTHTDTHIRTCIHRHTQTHTQTSIHSQHTRANTPTQYKSPNWNWQCALTATKTARQREKQTLGGGKGERESRRGEDRKREREAGRKWEKVAATGLAQSTLAVATQRSLCSELATVNTPKAIQFWTYLRRSLRHWRVKFEV